MRAGIFDQTEDSTMPEPDNKRLVDALNQLLEGEYIALIHYVQHAGSVRGMHFQTVVDWLSREATRRMDHAITLTQTLLSLGGLPDWEVGRAHPFSAAPEAHDIRRLLAHDLDHERQLSTRYVDAIALADELGEVGIRVVLEGILATEQRSMQEIERMTETP
jgi:bacterioferritin (cytochrome b1)